MIPIIGIDPGANGGIAYSFPTGVYVEKMPRGDRELLQLLERIKMTHFTPHEPVVFIEKVGKHRQGNNAQSSATFAAHCGALRMALVASGLDFHYVKPRVWQNSVFKGLPRDKKERKNTIKDAMQHYHPDIKVTLWAADALAIMHYGIQQVRVAA